MPFTKDELEELSEIVLDNLNVHENHWSKGVRDSWANEKERLKSILRRIKEEMVE